VNINEGEDNERFKFNVLEKSGILTIESEIEDLKKMHCTSIIIEDGDTTFINGMGARLDLSFEVFLPNSLELEVETINGDIISKGLTGPMELNTINGDIDLYVAQDLKADLNMETINGTMYTNRDIAFESKRGNLCKIGGDVETKLNGGGPEINLSTINGSMFLRKK